MTESEPVQIATHVYASWPHHLESAWLSLWRAVDAPVFSGPGWAKAWLETRRAYPMTVIEARDGTRLVGLLPLCRQTRSFHRRVPLPLRYWGVVGAGWGAADHVTPLADTKTVTSSLLACAAEITRGQSLLLEHLDSGLTELCDHAGMQLLGHTPVPRLDLGSVSGAGDVWSKKLRKNLRRRIRLAEEAGIRGRWVQTPEDVQNGLEKLRELHLRRWRAQGEGGLFDRTRQDFLRRVVTEESTGARMFLLEGLQGPAAALLVFCTPTSMSSYKTGWDPRFAELGLGIRLHAEAIQKSIEEGLRLYDFLRGTGAHKYALNAHDYVDVTYGRFAGLPGRALEFRERSSYRPSEPNRDAKE